MFSVQLKRLIKPTSTIASGTKVAETRIICNEGELLFDFSFVDSSLEESFTITPVLGGKGAEITASKDISVPDGIMLRIQATSQSNPSLVATSSSIELYAPSAFQSFFLKENTIYKVVNDFDLDYKALVIPKGCVLDFQGGSFLNGHIIFDNTVISADRDGIFSEVSYDGQLAVPVNINWWKTPTADMDVIYYYVFRQGQGVVEGNNTIFFPAGEYTTPESTSIVLVAGDSMKGEGSGSTHIKLARSSGSTIFIGAYHTGDSFIMESMKDFDPEGVGLYAVSRDNSVTNIQDIHFEPQANESIVASYCNYNIQDCFFSDGTSISSMNIVYALDGSEGSIHNCLFDNVGFPVTYGYWVTASDSPKNSNLSDCIFKNFRYPLNIAGIEGLNISGCSFHNSVGGALTLNEVKKLAISNCVFSSTSINNLIEIKSGMDAYADTIKISDCIISNRGNSSVLTIGHDIIKGVLKNISIVDSIIEGAVNGIVVKSQPSGSTPVNVEGCLFMNIKQVPVISEAPIVVKNNIFRDCLTDSSSLANVTCILVQGTSVNDPYILDNICENQYPVSTFLVGTNVTSKGNISKAGDTDTIVKAGVVGDFTSERVNSESGTARTNKGTTAMRPSNMTANQSGWYYFDTTLNKPFIWNGTSWVDLSAGGGGGEPVDLSDYVKMHPTGEQIIQANVGINSADSSILNLYRNEEKKGEIGLVNSANTAVGITNSVSSTTLEVRDDGKAYIAGKEIATIDVVSPGTYFVYASPTDEQKVINASVYANIKASKPNTVFVISGDYGRVATFIDSSPTNVLLRTLSEYRSGSIMVAANMIDYSLAADGSVTETANNIKLYDTDYIDGQIAGINGNFGPINTKITNLETGLGTTNTNVTNLTSRVTGVEGSVNTINGVLPQKLDNAGTPTLTGNLILNSTAGSYLQLHRDGALKGYVGMTSTTDGRVALQNAVSGAVLQADDDGKCYYNSKEIATKDDIPSGSGAVIVYTDAHTAENQVAFNSILSGNYSSIKVDMGGGNLAIPSAVTVESTQVILTIPGSLVANSNNIAITEMTIVLGSTGGITPNVIQSETYTKAKIDSELALAKTFQVMEGPGNTEAYQGLINSGNTARIISMMGEYGYKEAIEVTYSGGTYTMLYVTLAGGTPSWIKGELTSAGVYSEVGI